jgi:hypothetical protein
MTSHEAIDVYLDPEIVSFFPEQTQAALHAGSLALNENDFLLAASIIWPMDSKVGIRDGESLVVAKLAQPDGFQPECLINRAELLYERHRLRDADQPKPEEPRLDGFMLSQSSDRPYLMQGDGGRMFQVEERLFVPASAYGVWLQQPHAPLRERHQYAGLLPATSEHRIRIERREPAINN